jgi:GntR family transcriptional regulator
MALDFAPPRYAQLVTTVQDRISGGDYAPGALMPTEAQLATEFGVSRATVVRALQLLKAEGWIESRQGRGTFVRGRPAAPETPARRGRDLVSQPETTGAASVDVLHAGPAAPPPGIAAALALAPGESAFLRRRLLTVDGEPVELVSAWFPASVAEGTDLASPEPLPEGTAEHLRRRKRLRLAQVTERITARMPAAEETKALAIPRRVPVLDLLAVAYDADANPIQAATVVLPADRHELEDSYAIG